MKATRTFANIASAVKEARRFVEEQVSSVASDVILAVSLMVSELATNCIRHARTGFTITVNIDNELLRVTVTDDGSGVPVVRSPSVSEPTGRGLRIVSEFSDDWGTSFGDDTSVWFSLRLLDAMKSAESDSSKRGQETASSHIQPIPIDTMTSGLRPEDTDTTAEQRASHSGSRGKHHRNASLLPLSANIARTGRQDPAWPHWCCRRRSGHDRLTFRSGCAAQ